MEIAHRFIEGIGLDQDERNLSCCRNTLVAIRTCLSPRIDICERGQFKKPLACLIAGMGARMAADAVLIKCWMFGYSYGSLTRAGRQGHRESQRVLRWSFAKQC